MADIGKLYRDHYAVIFKFLMGLSRNENVAEELTQETFFRAYINIRQLRQEERAAVWLCRIARNLYYAWYREQKKLLPLNGEDLPSQEEDMAETEQTRALSAQAMEYLSQLDSPYREVFELSVFAGMPMKQISKLWGKSESWARVTFYRAKQKIAERMKEDDL